MKEIPISIRTQVLTDFFTDVGVMLLENDIHPDDKENDYETDWAEVMKTLGKIAEYNITKHTIHGN